MSPSLPQPAHELHRRATRAERVDQRAGPLQQCEVRGDRAAVPPARVAVDDREPVRVVDDPVQRLAGPQDGLELDGVARVQVHLHVGKPVRPEPRVGDARIGKRDAVRALHDPDLHAASFTGVRDDTADFLEILPVGLRQRDRDDVHGRPEQEKVHAQVEQDVDVPQPVPLAPAPERIGVAGRPPVGMHSAEPVPGPPFQVEPPGSHAPLPLNPIIPSSRDSPRAAAIGVAPATAANGRPFRVPVRRRQLSAARSRSAPWVPVVTLTTNPGALPGRSATGTAAPVTSPRYSLASAIACASGGETRSSTWRLQSSRRRRPGGTMTQL